jgi:chromosome segregation ATPase
VTTRRLLPLLNLAGCLILTGLIVCQWLKERDLGHQITGLNTQLITAQDKYSSEKTRSTALESDVAQLKESIASTTAARKETEAALAQITAEREAQIATTGDAQQALQAQTAVWEKAIAERDTKLGELATTLTITRERLDQAISKLKQAAAR